LHVNPNFCNPKKSIPVETVFERYTRLRAVKWVDDIIPYETEDDLRNMIYSERFDIRFLGSDYALKDDYTARAVIDEKYIPRFHDYSSSNLKLRISDRDYSRPARELGVAFRR
jgi:glycerol-3-phosphate cytidylyltransferase